MNTIGLSIIRGIAVTICLWGIHLGRASAAEPNDPRDTKIRSELELSTTIEFTDVPLAHCVAFLADLHRVPIELDEDELKTVKVTRLTPFTYKSPKDGRTSNFPLYRALWEMLGGSNVSFMIFDHKLLITSAKKAKDWQTDFVKQVESRRR